MENLKLLEVVAAAILRDGKVFAASRGYGKYRGWWEFPGGKIEAGESSEAALQREIFEELRVSVVVGDLVGLVEYDYPEFRVRMRCYFCEIVGGELEVLEHEDWRWLDAENLYDVKWLPSDLALLEEIAKHLN